MASLWFAVAVFIALHWLVPRDPLRSPLVRRIGERTYLRAFAVASLVVLVWMAIAYAGARHATDNIELFTSPGFARIANLIGQPIAWLLIVAGLSTPNPGTVEQGQRVERPDIVRGILRVTRHPFLWGVGLFAVLHVLSVPTLAGWALFGSLALIAITGTRRIDRKRARAWGAAWARFEQQTSNIPFVAIVKRRQPLRLGEIGWRRIAVAVVLYAAFAALHP
jgi:uncharacterized membrane protein